MYLFAFGLLMFRANLQGALRLDCLRSRRRLLQESRGAAYPSAAA